MSEFCVLLLFMILVSESCGFRLPYAKKTFAVLLSKVEILLLCKNLTYENFVSVAL